MSITDTYSASFGGSSFDVPPLAISGVSVAINQIPILRDINLKITTGEVVALRGVNGAGKTTLLRTILGLLKPQTGEIRIFGIPQKEFGNWSAIGYVPQVGQIQVENASVREVVAMGKLSLPWRKRNKVDIEAALTAVGLSKLINLPFQVLSGGQKQRVLIARALLSNPELLIFDEPMTGVDLVTQQALTQLIKALRDQGKTCLFVLHELGPLADIVDREITIFDGRILSPKSEETL